MGDALSYPIGNLGEGHSQGTRTRGQVLQDLTAWAEIHNGDTLTVTAWQALGLLGDIEARKSKVLVLGLCRTKSRDPKTYYTLKETCVVPMADLKSIYKNCRSVQGSVMHNPSRILKEQEKTRQAADGAIGAVLVMSVEQAEDDERSVLAALSQMSTMTFQPLGVFEEHRTSFSRMGQLPEVLWKACLINVLRGGLYAPTFRTS